MFLETITFVGENTLLQINQIESVFISATKEGYQINIVLLCGDKYTEGFSDNEKLTIRYMEIKEILGGR